MSLPATQPGIVQDLVQSRDINQYLPAATDRAGNILLAFAIQKAITGTTNGYEQLDDTLFKLPGSVASET